MTKGSADRRTATERDSHGQRRRPVASSCLLGRHCTGLDDCLGDVHGLSGEFGAESDNRGDVRDAVRDGEDRRTVRQKAPPKRSLNGAPSIIGDSPRPPAHARDSWSAPAVRTPRGGNLNAGLLLSGRRILQGCRSGRWAGDLSTAAGTGRR